MQVARNRWQHCLQIKAPVRFSWSTHMRLFIWIWDSPEWGAPDARMGYSAQDAWDEIGECW